MNRSRHGFTLLEMLLASSLLVVILSITVAFLSSEARSARYT